MPSSWQYQFANHQLINGKVVAYPTEGVWGLGCDPFNFGAVNRILAIKNRPVEKGMILVSGDAKHFAPVLSHLSAEEQSRFLAPTERPTTWLVPDLHNYFPVWVKGKHTSIALRLSQHPVVVELTRQFGGAIVSTSANPASRPSAKSPMKIAQYFKNEPVNEQPDYVLPGKLGGQKGASVIKDLATGNVLRA